MSLTQRPISSSSDYTEAPSSDRADFGCHLSDATRSVLSLGGEKNVLSPPPLTPLQPSAKSWKSTEARGQLRQRTCGNLPQGQRGVLRRPSGPSSGVPAPLRGYDSCDNPTMARPPFLGSLIPLSPSVLPSPPPTSHDHLLLPTLAAGVVTDGPGHAGHSLHSPG